MLHFDHGVELRLREGDDLRRGYLCRDGMDAAATLAADWHAKLLDAGWLVPLRVLPRDPAMGVVPHKPRQNLHVPLLVPGERREGLLNI